MGKVTKKEKRLFTYRDYLKWPEDERWEIIEGIAYNMSGASERHQSVSFEISRQLGNYFQNKKCKVYYSPFDVILPSGDEPDEEVLTVVQPDIFIVCDKKKIYETKCKGAPDLIIEILSPSTGKKDMREKRKLYEKNGVKEYWIVDPVHNTIQVFRLNDTNKYEFPVLYIEDDKILNIDMFPKLKINLKKVFKA
jgi:Uma2 family endonuclease